MNRHQKTALRVLTGAVVTVVVASVFAHAVWTRSKPSVDPHGHIQQHTEAAVSLKDISDVKELLFDSWVEEKSSGYFVDGAWSVNSSPFSLYETYWQLRWSQWKSDELEPPRMRQWLNAALRGELPVSLPKVAQVRYAAEIKVRIDPQRDYAEIGRFVDSFRSGGRYGAEPAAKATWGSTATSVGSLRLLKMQVPAEVTQAVTIAVRDYPERFNVAAAIEDVIPLVELVTKLPIRDAKILDKARGLSSAASMALTAVAPEHIDASYLGARYALNETLKEMDLPTTGLGPDMCHAVAKGGSVTLPGKDAADTQATFYARELGCQGVHVVDRPKTRAGWVIARAVDNALPATVAAVKIASAFGLSGPYAEKVRRSISELWSQAFVKTDQSTTKKVEIHARLSELTSLLGGKPQELPQLELDEGERRSVPAIVVLTDLLHSRSPENANYVSGVIERLNTTAHDKPRSIDNAIVLELAARVLGKQDLHRRAVGIVDALRLAPDVFASAECGSADACSTKPSIITSAFASWIEQADRSPWSAWVRAGLCRDLLCDNDNVPASSLRAVAMAVACAKPHCGTAPPFIF